MYSFTQQNKIQLTDTTIIKYPTSGGYLLQSWRIFCNDRNNSGKIQNFIRLTKTNSSTPNSGAKRLPPIGPALMYIETSSNKSGSDSVFCSFERIVIIQISKITFYYNRFSILTNDSIKSRGRFRIQLLLEDNTWTTQYTIAKNGQYSDSSTDWTLVILTF